MVQILGSTSSRYTYDPDCRLVMQQGPGAEQYDYRYDAASNLSDTPLHGYIERLQDNLLSHSHLERFEYDSRQRLSRRIGLDGATTTYTYDSVDQLVGVAWSNRPEAWRAGYDGLGRRIWRECGDNRTDFYWDGDRLAGEVAPNGSLRLYVYPNEDALVPFMWLDYGSVDDEPKSGVAYYLFSAPTGMPLRVEDHSGTCAWQAAALEPYGSIPKGSPTPPLRLRFAG
jgi:YD repeat-containing protein